MRNEKANSLLNWLFVYSAAGLQITAELMVFLNPSELKITAELTVFLNPSELSGYVYESFELEKDLVDNSYWSCYNLKEYFYSAMSKLPTWNLPQYKKDKVQRAHDIIEKTKSYEKDEMPATAESEIKKLIPELY